LSTLSLLVHMYTSKQLQESCKTIEIDIAQLLLVYGGDVLKTLSSHSFC
jgi:hypothetical protein